MVWPCLADTGRGEGVAVNDGRLAVHRDGSRVVGGDAGPPSVTKVQETVPLQETERLGSALIAKRDHILCCTQ